MKVALVQCPGWSVSYPPIGLACLNAFLKERGHEVFLFDFNLETFHSSLCKGRRNMWDFFGTFWQDRTVEQKEILAGKPLEWAGRILESGAALIGFSVFKANRTLALETAKKIKGLDRNKPVVFGGPESQKGELDFFIDEGAGAVDAFIIGEGERTLVEIIGQLEKGKKIRPGPGILIPASRKFLDGGDQIPIADLDSLPFPDFSDLPLRDYTECSVIPIQMSRGCVQKCVFCVEHVYWKKYRTRSAENTFSEMKMRFAGGYRTFMFCDSVLNGRMREFEKLIDLLIAGGIGKEICFSASLRSRPEMTDEIIRKIRKAGCDTAVIGVESGSQRIIDAMRKGYRIEIVEQNLKSIHEAGIKLHMNLIMGFPGENEETINETLDFVRRNRPYVSEIEINSLHVISSAILFENYRDFGIRTVHDRRHHNWVMGRNDLAWRQALCLQVQDFIDSLGVKTFGRQPARSGG